LFALEGKQRAAIDLLQPVHAQGSLRGPNRKLREAGALLQAWGAVRSPKARAPLREA